MKKIIASLFLACLSLAAGAQSSKFDTGTRSTSALGQLEEISGQKVSRPNNDHRIVIPATRAVSAASSARPSSGSLWQDGAACRARPVEWWAARRTHCPQAAAEVT